MDGFWPGNWVIFKCWCGNPSQRLHWSLQPSNGLSQSNPYVGKLNQLLSSRDSPANNFQVFVAIIQGPTVAKELMNGIQSNPKTDTMARKHGIWHTTPGAIAGTVVLVCVLNCIIYEKITLISFSGPLGTFSRWLFTKCGSQYGHQLWKDFEEYLEVLMIGLQKKKKTEVHSQHL